MPTYIFHSGERMTAEELRERLTPLIGTDEHVSVDEFSLRGDEIPDPEAGTVAVTVDREGYFEERVLPLIEASGLAGLEWEVVRPPGEG